MYIYILPRRNVYIFFCGIFNGMVDPLKVRPKRPKPPEKMPSQKETSLFSMHDVLREHVAMGRANLTGTLPLRDLNCCPNMTEYFVCTTNFTSIMY